MGNGVAISVFSYVFGVFVGSLGQFIMMNVFDLPMADMYTLTVPILVMPLVVFLYGVLPGAFVGVLVSLFLQTKY